MGNQSVLRQKVTVFVAALKNIKWQGYCYYKIKTILNVQNQFVPLQIFNR